ncbi:DUF5763 domain-containing protein [Ferruginibacter sp.]
MKWFLFLLAASSLIVGGYILRNTNTRKDTHMTEKVVSTCYGYTPCTACSSCNYCKWCKAGGTCGICANTEKKKDIPLQSKPQFRSSKQCQATTKKGTRCSRSSRSGGYCWQHGG